MIPSRNRCVGQRGSTLLLVLGILVIFALILGILASILLTDLRASRRRANERYAVELARSGVDWARAWLMERGQLPASRLTVTDGEIDVHVEELPSGGRRIVSVGRVVEGETRVAAQREIAVLSSRVDGGARPGPDLSATP